MNVTSHPPPGYGKMKVEGAVDSDHKNDKRMTEGHVEGGRDGLGPEPTTLDIHCLTVFHKGYVITYIVTLQYL